MEVADPTMSTVRNTLTDNQISMASLAVHCRPSREILSQGKWPTHKWNFVQGHTTIALLGNLPRLWARPRLPSAVLRKTRMYLHSPISS